MLEGTFQLFECVTIRRMEYHAAKVGDMASLRMYVEKMPWWRRLFGSIDLRKTLDYALQYSQLEASEYLISRIFPNGITDTLVVTSSVLSGHVPTIELVMGRMVKNVEIDNQMVFVACAKRNVSEDVWAFCLSHFPCSDFGSALMCALTYESTDAISYLMNLMEHVPVRAKLWCVNVEQLKMIHAKNDSWPENFLSEIENREMREFYAKHNASRVKRKLSELLNVIEELSIPEGEYLRVCNLMKEVHDAL